MGLYKCGIHPSHLILEIGAAIGVSVLTVGVSHYEIPPTIIGHVRKQSKVAIRFEGHEQAD